MMTGNDAMNADLESAKDVIRALEPADRIQLWIWFVAHYDHEGRPRPKGYVEPE